jgi:polysaccharide pyruvyl transferase WcaK-like protein
MKDMKKNIIILGVNPFNGNRGVGALAYSIIYLLDKLAEETKQQLNIYIIGASKRNASITLNVGENKIRISQFPLMLEKGMKGIVKFFFTLIFSYKVIKRTEYVLDIGEGDSFSDIYGKHRFFSINSPKKLFRFLGKKQLLLPQTIGPFNDPQIAKKAKRSIEKSQTVLTRDRISYDYVLNNTNQRNVKELIDVAFFMPYTKRIFKNEKINVGLNISSLIWHGGYTRNNQFGLNVDYQQLMRDTIDIFLSLPNVQLHLVPHVVSPNSHVENDYEVSRKIQDEYDVDRIILAPFFLDPIDAKNYISGLDFFAGARMHACIAAFSSGVPVYPIAYSRKFNGLFAETLKYPYLGDLINQTSEVFISGLKQAFENRVMLSEKIQWGLNNVVVPRYTVLMDELKRFLEIK